MTDAATKYQALAAWISQQKDAGTLTPEAEACASDVLWGIVSLQDAPNVQKLQAAVEEKFAALKAAMTP